MHTSYSQLKRAAVLGGILIGTFAFSALADWSNPTAAPTGGNAPAPLNVSSNWQSKAGALSIGNATNNSATSNLFVTGGALFDGVSTKTLNVGGTGSSVAGQVLTAADANGNVKWSSVSSYTPQGLYFGGMFTTSDNNSCLHANPMTNACNCPTGFSQNASVGDQPGDALQYVMYYCTKPTP